MSFQVGDTVGPYTIVGVVGAGGMARVFKVEHSVTRAVEAMKVLIQGQCAPELPERFLREIQIQASLNHPNIASVHNAFSAGDDLVMVAELVEGESLQSLLERGRLPVRLGIGYICQALSALSYAHARGITHRDIKPANMIITPDGVLKVTDFGLAQGPSDFRRLTNSGIPMGSAYYMPPEQIRGVTTLDGRTDLYSLGAVLYETLTGRRPFDGDAAFAVMRAHVEEHPTPPMQIAANIPSPLNDVMLKSLAKNAADRFQSADEFRLALEPFQTTATRAHRVSAGLPRRLRLQLVQVGMAALGVLFLSVGVWRSVSSHKPYKPEPIAKAIPIPEQTNPPKAIDTQDQAPAPVETAVDPEKPVLNVPVARRPVRLADRPQPVHPPKPIGPEQAAVAPTPVVANEPPRHEDANAQAPVAVVRQPWSSTMPRGTTIKVRNTLALSSNSNKAGDSFTTILEDALVVDGRVIAPKGGLVDGEILEADKGGRIKGRAWLSVRTTRLHAANGRYIQITTSPVELHGDRSWVAVPLKRGAAAVLPAGTLLNFQFLTPVTLGDAHVSEPTVVATK